MGETVAAQMPARSHRIPAHVDLALAVAGLALLYAPTLWDLSKTLWATEEQSHGPLILLIAGYLLWKGRGAYVASPHNQALVSGWSLLILGLTAYVIGRSQQVMLFEIGSLLCVLPALILLLRGAALLRRLWFPVFFLAFMLPLPGPIVDAVTMPMKIMVSLVVEQALYWGGYPIARTGVILHIGNYKLLIADACAGLQTLFTLEAMGLLYLNIVRHPSAWRNIGLAVLIVPISFCANVIRVAILTLVTYHLGDEAGQGFLHGFAGMVLFISALMMTIFVDSLLRAGMAAMGRTKHA